MQKVMHHEYKMNCEWCHTKFQVLYLCEIKSSSHKVKGVSTKITSDSSTHTTFKFYTLRHIYEKGITGTESKQIAPFRLKVCSLCKYQ